MKSRFKTNVAVFLILERNINNSKQILLQKRFNTGYMDGMWDCDASGHVEANESAKTAVIRESKEELGIDICYKDIDFATMSHILSDEEYIYIYFTAKKFNGSPKIMEPQKCSDLKWFDISNIPKNIIPDRKAAILNYLNSINYEEFYWK